jgi:hypothetical protein
MLVLTFDEFRRPLFEKACHVQTRGTHMWFAFVKDQITLIYIGTQ